MGFQIAEAFVEFTTRGYGQVMGALGGIRQGVTGLSGGFGGLTNLMGPLGTAISSLALPVSLGAGLTKAIKDFSDAEQAAMRLSAVLEATGYKAGLMEHHVGELAAQLQATTRIGDDDTKAAAARLATFESIASGVFERTLRDAAKLAVFLDTDMVSATFQLGRALESPADGLSKLARAGIMFTDEQKEAIKAMSEAGETARAQTAILEALEGKLGNIAEQDLSTLEGQFKKLSNQVGDAFEEVGALIVEFTKLPEVMATVERSFSGLTQAVRWFRGADEQDSMDAFTKLLKEKDRLTGEALAAAGKGDVATARALYGRAAEAALEANSLGRDDAKAQEARMAGLRWVWDQIRQAQERNTAGGLDLSGRKLFSGRDAMPDDKTVERNAEAARQRAEGLKTQTEKVRETMKALTLDFAFGASGLSTWTRGMAQASGQLPEVQARLKQAAEQLAAFQELGAQAIGGAVAGGAAADALMQHQEQRETRSRGGNLLMGVDQIWNRLQEGANRNEELVELKKQNAALQKLVDDGVKIKGKVLGVVGP